MHRVSLINLTSVSLLAAALFGSVFAEDFAPFPENRVRDFYFQQAEKFLASKEKAPDILPQFPGLDGGAFGHWGQNPTENSVDRSLNQVDSGTVIANHVKHNGRHSHKGVAINLSPSDAPAENAFGAVFDPLQFSFTDCWRGGFVSRGSNRFGVHDGATAIGKRWLDFKESSWKIPEGTTTRYRGYYRNGRDVVFEYNIGAATVLDRLWLKDGNVVRSIQTEGALPAGTELNVLQATKAEQPSDQSTLRLDTRPFKGTLQLIAPDNVAEFKTDNGKVYLSWNNNSGNRAIHLVFTASLSPKQKPEAEFKLPSPKSLTTPSAGLWTQQTVTTTGELGDESSAFAIDTITIPYAEQNPFGTPMRLTGLGSLGDGKMVVSTLIGDVWIVGGVDRDLRQLRWQRIATGLYQPLGLVVQNGKVLLGGKDQITRLHDFNGDGETDFYECVTNDYPTTGGHDFATSLQQDKDGRLYWVCAAHDFGLTQFEGSGPPQPIGNGLRNSNGIGVSADGQVTLATVQEGSWTPATAIFDVRDGSFHGHRGPRDGHGKFGYDLPQCFIPRGVDNSAGEIIFLPHDDRLGPLSGLTVGSSYGYGQHYLVLREETGNAVQGGIVPLPGEFNSGMCRWCFNPEDGFLYVAGTEGWQSYGRENGGLQRLRFTGKTLPLMTNFESRHNGLIVHCNAPIDPKSVSLKNVFCQQWNYLFSAGYGSPEYSVKDEGRQGHDIVEVRSVHLLPNGKSVFLEIPQIHPVMQFHVHLKLQTKDGAPFTPDAYLTLYEFGDAFTEFDGYQNIAKRPWPEFPSALEFEQDPRLVEQDKFGTNFGWVASAKKLTLKAATGLQYEPRRLRVAPGSRVALTFHNADPGMPHNVVIVKADKLERIGEQAMMLASNPRAIATHYVPDDPAEICFSPILNPGDQYTVYFEAPKETGRYRFLCTYPGHWKVMQGTFYIIPDDELLPELSPEEVPRKFVKRWSLNDFADEPTDLLHRDLANGERTFKTAGCIKCHRIGSQGANIGPELSGISKRFAGRRLLQQILEPSSEVNKKYQTWVALLTNGKVVTGLLSNRTSEEITLLPNPLQPESTSVLSTTDIEELVPSPRSTMPEGLLMTFTKDEILDLLAWLSSTEATPAEATSN